MLDWLERSAADLWADLSAINQSWHLDSVEGSLERRRLDADLRYQLNMCVGSVGCGFASECSGIIRLLVHIAGTCWLSRSRGLQVNATGIQIDSDITPRAELDSVGTAHPF
jgi:hypothetical protein